MKTNTEVRIGLALVMGGNYKVDEEVKNLIKLWVSNKAEYIRQLGKLNEIQQLMILIAEIGESIRLDDLN
jgi:hypothetical protein